MDAHLRWDWDILVLRRLGRWSQLRKRKCVLEVCFNIIKFDISNVQSTSLMKISVYACLVITLPTSVNVSVLWFMFRSADGLCRDQRLCCLLLSIWLRHLLLHLSCHLKLHFPACHHLLGSVSATKPLLYIYIYIYKLLCHILHLISLTILVYPRCKTWPFDLTLWE